MRRKILYNWIRKRKDELNRLVKLVVAAIRDIAQNEYESNFNATGMSGSHGNLDKRISRLLRERKNSITRGFEVDGVRIEEQVELDFVKEKLTGRAKKFEHDGRDKNHPFK